MIVGVLLMIVGGAITLANWSAPIVSLCSDRNVSMVPLVGGCFLALGIYVSTKSIGTALLGFALDLGTICFVVSLPWLAFELWSTSRFARVHNLKCHEPGRDISVELFQRGRAAMTMRFDPEHFEGSPVSIGFSAKWESRGEGFEVFEYADGRSIALTWRDGSYLASELSIPIAADSWTLLDGCRFKVA